MKPLQPQHVATVWKPWVFWGENNAGKETTFVEEHFWYDRKFPETQDSQRMADASQTWVATVLWPEGQRCQVAGRRDPHLRMPALLRWFHIWEATGIPEKFHTCGGWPKTHVQHCNNNKHRNCIKLKNCNSITTAAHLCIVTQSRLQIEVSWQNPEFPNLKNVVCSTSTMQKENPLNVCIKPQHLGCG